MRLEATIIHSRSLFINISREVKRPVGSPRRRMYASLQRDANEIQRHKAGWLASGTHKYLDDRGPIARPRGCVRCTLARSLTRATAASPRLRTHPCSSDLELIHGEVSCRRTGNLTEARPRKSRRKREKTNKKGRKGRRIRRERDREEERAKRESPTTRNSYTHPVCG